MIPNDSDAREVRPAKASLAVTPTVFLPLDLAQRILAALVSAQGRIGGGYSALAAELRAQLPKEPK